ncbi:ABC transporter permease [Rubripirellula amarantea]|nr:ABC transporter permease [Rubripirellula amarantea]
MKSVDEHSNEEEVATSKPSSMRLDALEIKLHRDYLLRSTNLTIAAGEITVIVGASGAGKSVLLQTLAGLVSRTGDAINWSGEIAIGSANERSRVGIVFQQFALFDELSPTENVQFAIDHRKDKSQAPSSTAPEWLGLLGIPSRTPTSSLSGGQKQRLAIARTLAGDPDVVLYDEPSSGLDAATGREVAKLIRQTHDRFGRTSVIVTHDYETMLDIADHVLFLDPKTQSLVNIPRSEFASVANRIVSVSRSEGVADSEFRATQSWGNAIRGLVDRFFIQLGQVTLTAVSLPWTLRPTFPTIRWALRFFLHYLRLVGGASAWAYLIIAGLIVGFTTTYFTLRFLPFRTYTQPLLIDELLASIGFALYRVLVPVLATVLIAARCGAAVAADVGVKRYGGSIDAMKTFQATPRSYLLVPIAAAFLVATPVLETLAYVFARMISAVTFSMMHEEIGVHFWRQHFDRRVVPYGGWIPVGFGWVTMKNLACGVASGVIGYYRGLSPKQSARDVSDAITSTVLWSTLCVLVIHFAVALFEFKSID